MPNEYKDYFSFENPGTFRISIKEAIDGGTSDPRNASFLKMFSMIDIGERAGSGIPDVFSVWNKEFGIVPEYEQKITPERTITILRFSNDKTSDKSDFQAINDISSDKLSDSRTRAILSGMTDRIEPFGSNKNRTYRKK